MERMEILISILYCVRLIDHLGNNGTVVSESGAIEQLTHNYPYGGVITDISTNQSLQPYKYNVKELDRMHGLNMCDFGARWYDVAGVPMWTSMNPLCEIYRYDMNGRVMYTLSAYGDKWMKTAHTTYNFAGDVMGMEERVYTSNSNISLLAGRRIYNSYYPSTRLLKKTTVSNIDRNGIVTGQDINKPTYDVLGNITGNDRPGTVADMIYSYDILRGWLKGISSPSGFSEQLQRETADNAQYAGNIGSMQWRNAVNGELHKYDYTYDGLGRLTDSRYSSSVNGTDRHYDEALTYNRNGSITSLLRNGMRNDGTFGVIDDLSVNYDGNRLLNVTDDAESLNYNGALDFNDGADMTAEYEYDSTGALTKDRNRGITGITYDLSHNPQTIVMNGGQIVNDYTSDGRKLCSTQSTGMTTTTDMYVDGLIIRNGAPLMWQFDGGYVALGANSVPKSWNYYITDHLGSTRMVVDSQNNIGSSEKCVVFE